MGDIDILMYDYCKAKISRLAIASALKIPKNVILSKNMSKRSATDHDK